MAESTNTVVVDSQKDKATLTKNDLQEEVLALHREKVKQLQAQVKRLEEEKEKATSMASLWKDKYVSIKSKYWEQQVAIKDLNDQSHIFRAKVTKTRDEVFNILDKAFCLPNIKIPEPATITVDSDGETAAKKKRTDDNIDG